MGLYHNGKKISGFNSSCYSSVIENISIPASGFILQDDGSYLYTLENDLVLSDSLVDMYFSKDCIKIGNKAQISVTSEKGKIYIHAKKLPKGTLTVQRMRIINPANTDDSYIEEYDLELAELQNPTFEDYSSVTYPSSLDDSLNKIVSKGTFGALLEGIKGALLNIKDTLLNIKDTFNKYLPLTGGTVGKLTIDNDVNWNQLDMLDANDNMYRIRCGGSDTTASMHISISEDDTNYNRIFLALHRNLAEGHAINTNSLSLQNTIDGTATTYRIYGEHNKHLLRDYLYPVDSVVCMSSNTNPSTKYGGTWSLIDKEYKCQRVTATVTQTNTSAATVYAYLSGHSIQFNISFTPSVDLTDTTIELFTISPNSCGATQFTNQANLYSSFSDSGQIVLSYQITTTGILSMLDVMVRGSSTASFTSGTSVSTGKSIVIMQNSISYMLDSFCDKFYFKRTA